MKEALTRFLWWIAPTPRKREAEVEREQFARLEMAEQRVQTLRARADQAARILEERRRRNHWRETIEQMIQGA